MVEVNLFYRNQVNGKICYAINLADSDDGLRKIVLYIYLQEERKVKFATVERFLKDFKQYKIIGNHEILPK